MPNIFEQLDETNKLLAEREAESEQPEEQKEPEQEVVQESEQEESTEIEQESEDEAPAKSHYAERKARRDEIEELRIKLAEQQARAATLEEIAKGKTQPQPQPKANPRPNDEEDPIGAVSYDLNQHKAELAAFKQERAMEEALAEVAQHARGLSKSAPDAIDVIDAGFERLCVAAKMINPHMSDKEIAKNVKLQNLQIAAIAKSRGSDPAEALYNYYKTLGVSVAKQAEEKPIAKNDGERLRAVVKNKEKSGSPIVGGTSSASAVGLTKEKVMQMTPLEYSRLSEEEKGRFYSSYA